jgi:replicative DNA helicase
MKTLYNIEAEATLLGCCLLDPKNVVPFVQEGIRDTAFSSQHQIIWLAISSLYDDHKPVDVLTVYQYLKENSSEKEAGGLAYISELPNTAPAPSGFQYWLDLVRDSYVLREATSILQAGGKRIADGDKDALAWIESKLQGVQSDAKEVEIKPIKQIVQETYDMIEEMSKGGIVGIPTGFRAVDNRLRGMKPGQMVVIGARPGMGKSSMALQIAVENALASRRTVFFTLEMSATELALRALSFLSDVDMNVIQDGRMTKDQYVAMGSAGNKLAKSPLVIDDTAGLTMSRLRARCLRWHRKEPVKLVVVDYLQLMGSDAGGSAQREREVAQQSNAMKRLAKELGCPILVLSQLNRDADGVKATLKNLRESGAIEQDADVVMFINSDGPPTGSSDGEKVCLTIAKNRSGRCGDVNMKFIPWYTKFEEEAL